MSSCSASEMPEVWVASCRIVIFDFSGSALQPAMYFDAGSSGEIRPSLIATASDMPPTSALAIEAVPRPVRVPLRRVPFQRDPPPPNYDEAGGPVDRKSVVSGK